jgi:hypothetical protein
MDPMDMDPRTGMGTDMGMAILIWKKKRKRKILSREF